MLKHCAVWIRHKFLTREFMNRKVKLIFSEIFVLWRTLNPSVHFRSTFTTFCRTDFLFSFCGFPKISLIIFIILMFVLLVLLPFIFMLTFPFLSLRLYTLRWRLPLRLARMLNNDAVHLFSPRDIKSSFYSAQLLCYVCRMWCFLFLGSNICHKNYARTIKFMIFSLFILLFFANVFIRFPSMIWVNYSQTEWFISPLLFCYRTSWYVWNIYNRNKHTIFLSLSLPFTCVMQWKCKFNFPVCEKLLHNKVEAFPRIKKTKTNAIGKFENEWSKMNEENRDVKASFPFKRNF